MVVGEQLLEEGLKPDLRLVVTKHLAKDCEEHMEVCT